MQGGEVKKRWFQRGYGGKKGCGSKPFVSRLSRFSLFVGCIVISFLNLLDFGRRLGFWVSRFTVIFVSCITLMLLSLSDFGRRLCSSRFTVVFLSCITLRPLSLLDFGRRQMCEVICLWIGSLQPLFSPYPFPSTLFPCEVFRCFPFPVTFF